MPKKKKNSSRKDRDSLIVVARKVYTKSLQKALREKHPKLKTKLRKLIAADLAQAIFRRGPAVSAALRRAKFRIDAAYGPSKKEMRKIFT